MNEQIRRSPEGEAERAFRSLSGRLEPLEGGRMRFLLETDRFVDSMVREAFLEFRVNAGPQLPEEVPFQVDFGKAGGSDLIFNTRKVRVYIAAPLQEHHILLGDVMGSGWFAYLKPILGAIQRELSQKGGQTGS